METVQVDMNDERDAGTGRFAQKYDDEEFFNALREHDGATGTATVADVVGCPQRTAYHHLDRLREENAVSSQQIGGSTLWLLVNESEVEA